MAISRRPIPLLIGSLLILGVALAVCKPTLLAQNKPPAPPNESFKQFLERARARPAPVPSSEDPLADCQRNLKRWTDWGDVNVPRHEVLLADYEKLRQRNLALEEEREKHPRVAIIVWSLLVATALGFYLLRLAVRFVKRIRPFSRARKQLFVLLAVAVWVSVVSVLSASDPGPSHPIGMLAVTLTFSLPGLLFGGICFWWFSRADGQST